MESLSLIEAALAAGATGVVGESATAAVKDAYASVRRQVAVYLHGEQAAEEVLDRYAADPETNRRSLIDLLRSSGAGQDSLLVDTAEYLMTLLQRNGNQAGGCNVNLRDAQGVQVNFGDGNIQTNTFTQLSYSLNPG